MKECTSYEIISEYMPTTVRKAMARVSEREKERISEIRLYSGRAPIYVYPDKIKYLTQNGLTGSRGNTAILNVSAQEVRGVVDALCHYSLHTYQREMKQGYFVLRNGIRVGMSGTYSDSGVITEACGLNFRLSRNINGCGQIIFDRIMSESCGVLICGGVNSGKTTILRDLCRLIGSWHKVSLIDERNEIACVQNGISMNDVGALTDILSGCGRSRGIISAIRTLSPDYIICDEISTAEDLAAITESAGSGVKFCATIHGSDWEEIISGEMAKNLMKRRIFKYAAILHGADEPGKIREIKKLFS